MSTRALVWIGVAAFAHAVLQGVAVAVYVTRGGVVEWMVR